MRERAREFCSNGHSSARGTSSKTWLLTLVISFSASFQRFNCWGLRGWRSSVLTRFIIHHLWREGSGLSVATGRRSDKRKSVDFPPTMCRHRQHSHQDNPRMPRSNLSAAVAVDKYSIWKICGRRGQRVTPWMDWPPGPYIHPWKVCCVRCRSAFSLYLDQKILKNHLFHT